MFSDSLRGFIRKRVGDEHYVDDILQDAFIKIHKNLGKLQDEGKLRSWLYRIVRNTIIDYYRNRKPAEELPDDFGELVEEATLGREVSEELAPCVKALMERLSDKDRMAIEKTEFDGLTQKELSETLSISFSGAKSRVQRARGRMKDLLLECCSFELDRQGNILDYTPKAETSEDCCGESYPPDSSRHR